MNREAFLQAVDDYSGAERIRKKAEYVDQIDALIEDLAEAHSEVDHRCPGIDCPIYSIVLRYSDRGDGP